MSTRPPASRYTHAVWIWLENLFDTYSPATLLVYLTTVYLLLSSLFILGTALWNRWEGGFVWGAGNKNDPMYELGTSLGFWGSVYFCLNFLLATRWSWIERIFGGLDKVYKAHAFIGKATLTLVVLHGVVLVLQAWPDQALLAKYLWPGVEWGYTVGVAGLLLMMLLVGLTIWVRLQYQTWLASHKWLGVAFVLGNLHAILLQADWYMVLMTLLGGYAWAYNVWLYQRWAPKQLGVLEHNTLKHNVNELHIRLPKPLRWQPGQFVFLSVAQSSSGLSSELHPFSISGHQGSLLRVSAKRLGDFTSRLHSLTNGDKIHVFGPYGHFGKRFLQDTQDALWIAGGIGITPFLGLLQHEAHNPQPQRRIVLVWSVRSQADAVYLDELQTYQSVMPHFSVLLHLSEQEGYLTLSGLTQRLGPRYVLQSVVYLCGPLVLTKSLTQNLRKIGLKRRDILSEEFALR